MRFVFLAILFSLATVVQPIKTNNSSLVEEMNNEYNEISTEIIQFLYGPGFLSQGGSSAVDRMFRGMRLRDKDMLDIGCGLGGVDAYLAQKHPGSRITGIDPVERMIKQAQQRTQEKKLDTNLKYVYTPKLPYPFKENSFDIAFSKEALLHCNDKESLFKEVFRVLKPGGFLIIVDWLFSERAEEETTTLFNIPTFSPATTKEYKQYLRKAGFSRISTTVLNPEYCKYTKNTLEHLVRNKKVVCNRFGVSEYDNTFDAWSSQYDLFTRKELLVTLVKATKPTSKKTKRSVP